MSKTVLLLGHGKNIGLRCVTNAVYCLYIKDNDVITIDVNPDVNPTIVADLREPNWGIKKIV